MARLSSRSLSRIIAANWAYGAALMVRGAELIGKFGLYLLVARVLGMHEAGMFFLAITWIGLAATIGRAGFERAVLRHLAAELAVGNQREARSALAIASFWVLVGAFAVSIGTAAVAYPVSAHLFHDPDFAHVLLLATATILPQTLGIFLGQALTGYGRGVAGQMVANGLWPVLTFLAVLAGVRGLDNILWAMALANIVGAAVGVALVVVEWRRPRPAPASPPSYALEKLPALWRTALPLGVVEVLQVSLNSVPVLVLASFASASDVGAFSVANRISMLVWVVIVALGTISAPTFAACHRQGQWDELRRQNRRTRLLVAASSVPVVGLMLLFPGPLLHLIGPGFEIGATALVILGIGQLVNCLLPCQDVMLAMTGHGSTLRWLNVAQLISCVVLCAVLIPAYGMIGAAVAAAVVIAQGGIGTAWAVRRLMPLAF